MQKLDRSRVIIFGTHSRDWMMALRPDAPVWQTMPGVAEVVLTGAGNAEPPTSNDMRTIVIPLMEDHIATCPPTYASLKPSDRALQVLQNKAAFATYACRIGLGHLCPEVYPHPDAARFPCVVKRTDLNGGIGIRVVASAEELRTVLLLDPWRGHPHLLQAFVGPAVQRVTHCVCRDGDIRWHCTYSYEPATPATVCNRGRRLERIVESPARLAELASFLSPLEFTGPCSIDYMVTDAGATVVLEINPRFGGSLMRPDQVADLRAALSTILALAS